MKDQIKQAAHIEECLRCGYCCRAIVCQLGQSIYSVRENAECPGLSVQPDGQHDCGLVSSSSAIKKRMAQRTLAVGKGCPWYWRCNNDRLKVIATRSDPKGVGMIRWNDNLKKWVYVGKYRATICENYVQAFTFKKYAGEVNENFIRTYLGLVNIFCRYLI